MAEDKKNQEEGRKVNPWIPIAVVAAIVALVAIMAAMSGNTNNTATTNTDQAASGTTQSGSDTSGASDVDVSWITLDTTPNQVVEKAGIPAKMLQQLISVTDADMDKPFKDLGGDATIEKVVSVVSQFGGGSSSGMGGTTTP